MLIDGHRPQRIVSAGFAGALCPDLRRNDILVADRLQTTSGDEMPVDLPAGLTAALQHRDVHRGTLLTADRVIRVPSEKRAIGRQYGAMAVDMETFAVADVCRQRGVPFSSIRVINDTSDEVLPTDVEYLLGQKPGAAQWGAALGAVLRRPASAKDMYQLRENALVASLRLAKFMAETGFE
jgi:adenosylhomocysteine nucleosidase